MEKYNFVENIEQADFILGCTVPPGLRTIDYVPILEKAIKNKLPFICANPDYESIERSSKSTSIKILSQPFRVELESYP